LAKPWGRLLWRVNEERPEANFAAFTLVKLLQIGIRSRDAVLRKLPGEWGAIRKG
jgi:hypothetical protein